jgi:flavin-binding protein dodecin
LRDPLFTESPRRKMSIEDGNIKGYRVNLEVTFQLEDRS